MNDKFSKIILVVTFVLILIFGIIYKQPFIQMLPLLISLFIMFFQAKANRYAYIAGGLNSLLYAYVYFRVGLYATAASVAFFSFPVQIITFVNWNKDRFESSTRFKKMSGKARIYTAIGFMILWFCVSKVLRLADSQYAFLDNIASLLGILVSILTMLAYIEYSYLWIASAFIGLVLNIQVVLNEPGYISYVIYSVYNAWCVVCAFINVKKLYGKQQETNLI